VFLPDGEVWTLTPQALNDGRFPFWFRTTYMSGGAVSGLRILGPSSPSLPAIQTYLPPIDANYKGPLVNCLAATIIVYGTTGQVVSQ
jgi:hypothetical protein